MIVFWFRMNFGTFIAFLLIAILCDGSFIACIPSALISLGYFIAIVKGNKNDNW